MTAEPNPDTVAEPSAAPGEGVLTGLAYMADLMQRMKTELESQFALFARAREQAEARLLADLPEAELKLCRADLKAAVDALSVIVRTLEKVDEMERRIMRDQQELAALPGSEADYERLMETVERMIEARVAERLASASAPPVPDAGEAVPKRDAGGSPGPDAAIPDRAAGAAGAGA